MAYDVRYVELARAGHPEAPEEAVTTLCNDMVRDGWRLAHVIPDHIAHQTSAVGIGSGGFTRGVVLFFERP